MTLSQECARNSTLFIRAFLLVESMWSGNETNLCYCGVGSMRVLAITRCFVSAFGVLFADG